MSHHIKRKARIRLVIIFLLVVSLVLPTIQIGNGYINRSKTSILGIESQNTALPSSDYGLNGSTSIIETSSGIPVTPGTVVTVTIEII